MSIKAGNETKRILWSSVMFTLHRSLLIAFALFFVNATAATIGAVNRGSSRVLLYTATFGWVHDSIPAAVESLLARASSINVEFDHTEDVTKFNYETLKQYDAVFFLLTTGEALDDAGKAGFQEYVNNGGRFIGAHSASDTMYTTEFYGKEVGAYFASHPATQNTTMVVLDPTHPSTQGLPLRWELVEEVYNFRTDPRDLGAIVVLTVDPSSYNNEGVGEYNHGEPHPIAWYQEHGAGAEPGYTGGRSFYTALGHPKESWSDDTFMSHILGGIQWTLGDL